METRVRLGMTTVGVDVSRGDFLLNSEKRELLNVAFPRRLRTAAFGSGSPLPAGKDFLPCGHFY